MTSDHPGLVYEYLQNRILYREHTRQIFWSYDITQVVFLHEGYHELAVERF